MSRTRRWRSLVADDRAPLVILTLTLALLGLLIAEVGLLATPSMG